MTPQPPPERIVDALRAFDELLALDDGEQPAYVAAIESADPELAGWVRALCAADRPEAALEIERRLSGESAAADNFATVAPGATIGEYRVERRLGQGGMGEVYLAGRQRETFVQKVALKLLRRELAEPRSIERFHRECRIQARLDHPGIVPLLDVGVAPDGRPFLVLPYVDGRPITDYADEHRLSFAARIRQVVICCRAVEAAHVQLIVHRDIKPTNILVDTAGQIRLLDFGVAAALDEEADLTRQAPAPMTPERAAPEQLRGERASTSSDVWGLGVLLYELATGRPPFATAAREPAAIERALRDRGPTRPSRSLPATDDPFAREKLARLAELRSTTPRRLARELEGDLERVLHRALAYEPERRYPSAAALADDLERLLAQRPVVARADSFAYRLRRFVDRHPAGMASAAVATVALLTLAGVLVHQSVRVARERDRAAALEKQSTAVVTLLTELFGATAPNRGAGVGEVSIDHLLDEGEVRATALADAPGIRQRMFTTLGRIRLERSELPQGIALLERARAEPGDPLVPVPEADRIALELDYTRALFRADRGGEARPLLTALVDRLDRAEPARSARAGEAAELAEALQQLALVVPPEEAPALAERSLSMRRSLHPPRPVDVAASLDAVGNLAHRRGDFAAARAAWAEAVPILERELGGEDLATLSTLNNLVVVTDDPAAQLPLFEKLLAVQLRRLGPDSVPVANLRNNLGVTFALLGRYEEAENALRESHRLRVALLGIDHRETVRTLRNVARIVELRGHAAEAVAIFGEVIARLPATGLPSESWPPYVAQRAVARWRAGEQRSAAGELDRALVEMRASLPPGHDEIATALLASARFSAASGDADAAVARSREAFESRRASFPPTHPKLAEAGAELGRALLLAGPSAEGQLLLSDSLPRLDDWGLLHPDDRAALASALAAAQSPRDR